MRKNIQHPGFTRTRMLFLVCMLATSFMLNGCSELTSTAVHNPTSTASPDVTPESHTEETTATQDPQAPVTPLPDNGFVTENSENSTELLGNENSNSISESAAPEEALLLTAEEAKTLIEEKLDMRKYAVTLLSEALSIGGNEYYQFVVSEQALAIEPTLIVNKYDGSITCLASDGTITAYSSYPLYNPLTDAICDWNGIYRRHISETETNATILMGQGDPTSFEFCIDAINSSLNIGQLYGTATIKGNTASFTDEQGFSLSFTMTDDGLTITESGLNIYAGHNVTFNGDYTYEQEFTLQNKITSDKAIRLLKTLSSASLNLPNSIINYQVRCDDMILNVHDKICYTISIYDTTGESETLMNTYYVAIDGSVIYRYDLTSLDDVMIYEAS